MIDTSLSWKIVQSSIAAVGTQNNTLNIAFTSGLLDILAIVFVLFGLGVFVFSLRKRAVAPSDHRLSPPRRPVAVLSVAMLALPLLGLIFVWTNIPSPSSPLPPTPTPIAHHTPTATPMPTPALDLVTPGMLTVGSDTNYPPQESLDANQRPVGFDIDLITAIAGKLGLHVQIVSTSFSMLLNSWDNKQFDVAISGIPITPDNQKLADFVPYLKSGESLLVSTGNPKKINKLSDLCGRNVGVQENAGVVLVPQKDLQKADADCKAAKHPGITIVPAPTADAVVQLLVAKTVDATYQDSPITDYYVMKDKGQFVVGGAVIEIVNEGIAVRKGNTSLLSAIQKALNQLTVKDGKYSQLITQYGFTNEPIVIIDERHLWVG